VGNGTKDKFGKCDGSVRGDLISLQKEVILRFMGTAGMGGIGGRLKEEMAQERGGAQTSESNIFWPLITLDRGAKCLPLHHQR
jgi:hypothetical protein